MRSEGYREFICALRRRKKMMYPKFKFGFPTPEFDALSDICSHGREPSDEMLAKLDPIDVEKARKYYAHSQALYRMRDGIEPSDEMLAQLDPYEVSEARRSWRDRQPKPPTAAERLEEEFGIVITTQYDMAQKKMRSGFYTTRRISSDGSDDGFRQAVSKTTLTPYHFDGTAEELLAELLSAKAPDNN
jgi:hypothetical protein